MNNKIKTLQQVATDNGYEIRHFSIPLQANEQIEKAINPFDFSEKYGGTVDSLKYYNDFYLYPIKNK
jgi:hypothetical protein